MKMNRRWILICVLGLIATCGFLVVQGQMSGRDDGTEVVQTTVSPSALYVGDNTAVTEGAVETGEPEKSEKVAQKEKQKEEEDDTSEETASSAKESDSSVATGKKKTSQTAKNQSDKQKKKNTKSGEGEKNAPNAATQTPAQSVTTSPTASETPQRKRECELTITCESVFSHMDKLSESAKRVIPSGGVFLKGTFEIQEGDTAFDLLKRACGEKNILLDYVFTPIYSSYYIRGIGNLYEFDAGDESGWMYTINGKEPGYGCNQYVLSGSEQVMFSYDCER